MKIFHYLHRLLWNLTCLFLFIHIYFNRHYVKDVSKSLFFIGWLISFIWRLFQLTEFFPIMISVVGSWSWWWSGSWSWFLFSWSWSCSRKRTILTWRWCWMWWIFFFFSNMWYRTRFLIFLLTNHSWHHLNLFFCSSATRHYTSYQMCRILHH